MSPNKTRSLKELKRAMLVRALSLTGFVAFLVFVFVTSLLFLAVPLALTMLIDSENAISPANIAAIVGLLVLGHGIEYLSVFIKNRLTLRFHVAAVLHIYKTALKIGYDKFISMGASTLQSKIANSAGTYAKFFLETIPTCVISSIMILATLAIVANINLVVAALMFATLPLNYFGYKLLNKKLKALSVELNDVFTKAWMNENAVVSQVDFIKQASDKDVFLPFIERQQESAQRITASVNNYANGVSGLISGLNNVFKSLLVLILAAAALADSQMFGSVVFVVLIIPYFTSAVSQLTRMNLNLSAMHAADEFFGELLDNQESDGRHAIGDINRIEFDVEQVFVGSGDERKLLLRDVKMAFKKGDIVGIVGETGAGKSTLVKMLMKYRDTGGVFIDGVPLADISNESYFGLASYFSQNAPIITDTVMNNLTFGTGAAGRDRLGALPFLEKFSDRQEIIYENGANLSGGDKQRIALARYFIEKSALVVLDEPTSSIDGETETEILEEVFKASAGKIIFYVTHKAENLRYCTHRVEVAGGTATVAELGASPKQ